MLVLTRKLNERIVLTIGSCEIEIAVVRLGNQAVRIGVEAPEDVKVMRGELVGSKVDEVA
jgi:carbon storage regulator CsrA